MSTNALIRAAIESRLSTWAASQTPAIPVAWQNAAFTPPPGRYLRAYLLPAESDSLYVEGGDRLRVGLYQIDVCVPLGTGPNAAETIVAALEGQFPAGLRLTSGARQTLIAKPLSAKPAQNEGAHYVVPCRLQYRLHST